MIICTRMKYSWNVNFKFRMVSESHHWQSSYLVITLFSPLPAFYKGSLTIHTSNLSKKICYRILLITSILIVHVSRASEDGWIQIFPMLSLMPKSFFAPNWYRSLITTIHQSLQYQIMSIEGFQVINCMNPQI